ncbi:MAG: JAB domain-containing protein [Ferruginibacter sp.]
MIYLEEKVAEIEVSYKPANSKKVVIKSASDAFTELIKFFDQDTISLKEKFMVMYLNRGNKVLGVFQLSDGGITSTVVNIRLILSVAVKIAAVNLIFCHNHPSGNLIPSTADKEITCRIIEACKLLDIKVLDHLIITGNDYYSFAENGLL